MTIAELKKLPDGETISGVYLTVETVGKPPHQYQGQWKHHVKLTDGTSTEKYGPRVIQAEFDLPNNTPLVRLNRVRIDEGEMETFGQHNVRKIWVKQYQIETANEPFRGDNKPKNNDDVDWDTIARGKVRHGVVTAYIAAGVEPELTTINYWVEFIVTGKAPLPLAKVEAEPESWE